jgi:hypothetical protein
MKAVVCLTCMLLQTSLAQAQEWPSGRLLEQKPRAWREARQPQEEEPARDQFQPHALTRGEAKAHNAASAAGDPAPEKPKLQAKAYRLLSVLTDDELEKVRQKDVLRLASRGQDYIPQNNPVLARIAEHAGITVRGWFARLSASDFVGSIGTLQSEMKPSSTGSVRARIPEQPATSEPKQLPHGAAQTSPERLSLHVRLPGIVYPGDPGAVPIDPRLLARGQRMRLRAADNRH